MRHWITFARWGMDQYTHDCVPFRFEPHRGQSSGTRGGHKFNPRKAAHAFSAPTASQSSLRPRNRMGARAAGATTVSGDRIGELMFPKSPSPGAAPQRPVRPSIRKALDLRLLVRAALLPQHCSRTLAGRGLKIHRPDTILMRAVNRTVPPDKNARVCESVKQLPHSSANSVSKL
jgi:hypothetical protein